MCSINTCMLLFFLKKVEEVLNRKHQDILTLEMKKSNSPLISEF